MYGTWRARRSARRDRAPRRRRAAPSPPCSSREQPDSAGSQFFICVTDQPSLDGKYTIFGRVSEGLDVVQRISETPANAEGLPAERIAIRSIAIRDTPPPEPEPFASDSPADLAQYRAVLDTTAGAITIEFLADKAPEHVRNFLRLAVVRRARRDVLPPRRARLRDSGGLSQHARCR